jgi:hypothetical protein
VSRPVSDPLSDPAVRRKLAVLRHADEVTGNVAMTCRYFSIRRQLYYMWLRRYPAEGLDGLRDRSRRPKTGPHATDVKVVEKVVHLRRTYHFGLTEILSLQRYLMWPSIDPRRGTSSTLGTPTGCRLRSATSGATASGNGTRNNSWSPGADRRQVHSTLASASASTASSANAAAGCEVRSDRGSKY